MSKSLRLPEKWFRRGLWLVAVVFASFLIGLGGLVVGNLPQAERVQEVEDFIPAADAERVRAALRQAQAVERQADKARDTARLKYDAEKARYQSARESFDNWVATRRATERPEQDSELIARTQASEQRPSITLCPKGGVEQYRLKHLAVHSDECQREQEPRRALVERRG